MVPTVQCSNNRNPLPSPPHHEWKDNTDLLHNLEDTEHGQKQHLEQSEGVDPDIGNLPQEFVVWFVLVGHKDNGEPLDKLQWVEGGGRRV